MKRVVVYYTGNVQGVGFRYTTESISRNFKVSGWVKNLKDGRVKLHSQGVDSEVNAFLDAIGEKLSANIHGFEMENADNKEDNIGFKISF